ncbi:MAG: nuclear transport factor 2 family protein [Gemmatimonadota bacterium]|nr:nuclear transport factor 2 family protein [Gemmatimonadota bacterium]
MAANQPNGNDRGQIDPADDAPIKETLRTLYGAIERFDADEMKQLLSRDFELLEPERPTPIHWDRDEFVETVSNLEGHGKPEYQLDQFYIQHDGEIAYSGYRNRFTFRGETSNSHQVTHEMAVLAFRDGEWVIEKIRAWIVANENEPVNGEGSQPAD